MTRSHSDETVMNNAPEALRFERFRLTYPSGTAIDAYYGEGVTLDEVKATHPPRSRSR